MIALLWQKTWPIFVLLALWVGAVYFVRYLIRRFKGMQ